MHSRDRTKEELYDELAQARRRVSELEALLEDGGDDSSTSAVDALDLQRRADYFQIIVDHSQAILFIVDPEGSVLLSEGAALSRLGLEPGESVGKSAFELFENAPGVIEGLHSALNGRRHHAEVDVGEVTFDVFFSPYRGAGDQVLGMLGMALDITKHKQLERALRQSEAQLVRAQQVARLGIYEWTVGKDAPEWSDEMFEIYGVPRDQTPTLGLIRSLIHEDDRAMLESSLSRVHKEGPTPAAGIEYRIVRPDGEQRDLQTWAQGDRDASGTRKLFGVIQDITDTKLAQTTLRRSEARLRVAFDAAADYLILLDRDHRIRMANRTQAGGSAAELIGRPLYEMVPEEHRERIRGQLDLAIETRERQHYETSFTTRDGRTLQFSAIVVPIVVEGEVTGTLVSSRDITEELRLEEERKKFDELRRRAQKMEAIGRLAGGIAHDFNNVLCAIAGNAELALSEPSVTEPVRESLVEINQAAGRAAELTGQLLAYSRKQVITPKSIDLDQMVASLHSVLEGLIGEGISLTTGPAGQLGRVRMDPLQVEQIVLNLVENARDAMPEGGEITIETEDCVLDDEYCEEHLDVAPGRYVRLAVRDRGVGIPEDVRDKIFEPFFTTKERGHGTGLGLATVFGIVERGGGHIDVTSDVGRGTSIDVYLPRIDDEADALPEPKTPGAAGGTETILVVEDEEMVARLAVRLLARRGYDVLVAHSGEAALALAEGHPAKIDLLVTDVVMPNMNGAELAKRLTGQRPGLRVLYTSGFTDEVIAQHGVLDAGTHFLPKPYSLVSLAVRVREVLDADRETGPEVANQS